MKKIKKNFFFLQRISDKAKRHLKRCPLSHLDCTTHISNMYHMLHTKWFFRMLTHSKLGMAALAIPESGWWEKLLAIQLVMVWVIRNSHNPQISCALHAKVGNWFWDPHISKYKLNHSSSLNAFMKTYVDPFTFIGPFRSFMVLIDTSTRWSHVCLLSTRNHAFAKLIAQVIRLRASQRKHQIKSIRMDNAAAFSSKAFNELLYGFRNWSTTFNAVCSHSERFSKISHQENKAHR